MDVNSLPDLCLQNAFANLDLTDLVYLNQVTPFWEQPQAVVARTHTKLVLLVGPNPLELLESPLCVPRLEEVIINDDDDGAAKSKWPSPGTLLPSTSDLKISEEDFNAYHVHIAELLPSIRDLIIYANRVTPTFLLSLANLVTSGKMFETLKSLHLHAAFSQYDTEDDFTCLANDFRTFKNALNSLPAIERLTLDIHNSLCLNVPEALLQFMGRFTVIEKLRQFSFYSQDPASIIFPALKTYKLNENLEKIEIANPFPIQRLFDIENLFEPEKSDFLRSRITALPNWLIPASIPQLSLFLDRFPSLTTLWLNLAPFTLSQLTTHLATLPSLVHLHLTIDYQPLADFDDTPDGRMARLPSIRVLFLMLSTRRHTELASRHWAWIFPSVQIVELYHFGVPCLDCNQLGVKANLKPISDEERVACLAKLLSPLKACQALRKLYTADFYPGNENGHRREWTVSQL